MRASEGEAARRVQQLGGSGCFESQTPPPRVGPAPPRRLSPAPSRRRGRHATPSPGQALAPYLVFGGQAVGGEACAAEGDAGRARVRQGTALTSAAATSSGTHEASASCLGTMGLGSRGILAVLALGVVVGVALLKIIADSTDTEGKWLRGSPAPAPGGVALPIGSFQVGSGCAESSATLRPNARGRPGGELMAPSGGKLRLGPVPQLPQGRLLKKWSGPSPQVFCKQRTQAWRSAYNLLSYRRMGLQQGFNLVVTVFPRS